MCMWVLLWVQWEYNKEYECKYKFECACVCENEYRGEDEFQCEPDENRKYEYIREY